jgi:hypothetical protein
MINKAENIIFFFIKNLCFLKIIAHQCKAIVTFEKLTFNVSFVILITGIYPDKICKLKEALFCVKNTDSSVKSVLEWEGLKDFLKLKNL